MECDADEVQRARPFTGFAYIESLETRITRQRGRPRPLILLAQNTAPAYRNGPRPRATRAARAPRQNPGVWKNRFCISAPPLLKH